MLSCSKHVMVQKKKMGIDFPSENLFLHKSNERLQSVVYEPSRNEIVGKHCFLQQCKAWCKRIWIIQVFDVRGQQTKNQRFLHFATWYPDYFFFATSIDACMLAACVDVRSCNLDITSGQWNLWKTVGAYISYNISNISYVQQNVNWQHENIHLKNVGRLN